MVRLEINYERTLELYSFYVPCSLVPCIDQTCIGSTDLVIGQAEKIVVLKLVPVHMGVSCLALCMLVFRI